MPPNDSKKDFNAETLLSNHEKDISGLGEKLTRCYSVERYEEFQAVVEKIVLKTLGSEDGGEKIKKHAREYFKGQVGWAVLIWLITLIGSMVLQKFFNVF